MAHKTTQETGTYTSIQIILKTNATNKKKRKKSTMTDLAHQNLVERQAPGGLSAIAEPLVFAV